MDRKTVAKSRILLPPPVEMMRKLITLPSVSSARASLDMSNMAVLEQLRHWLDDLGFVTRLQPVSQGPDKANLIATLGEGSGGLVLAGHTDTVPWDEQRWQCDPFAGEVRDERLYGLGSADMKSFLALAIHAASRVRLQDLRQPLIILATADEECSMAGARALARAGTPQARAAIVGEPTGLRPVRLHKGIMMERIHLIGRSGHSSDPALGRNALEGMHRVITALLALREQLAERYHHPGFAVPSPTMNLGHIHGGDNPNRICGECELHLDLRLLPGMEIEQTRTWIREAAEAALHGSELHLDYSPLFEGTAPMETPEDSPIVAAVEQLTGYPASGVNFGTEGPFYRQMGMDTVILGPGNIDQAHQPDEYLALSQMEPTLELLESLIRRFCMTPAQVQPPGESG